MQKSRYIQIGYIHSYILSKDEKDPCSIKEVMAMCLIAHVPPLGTGVMEHMDNGTHGQ